MHGALGGAGASGSASGVGGAAALDDRGGTSPVPRCTRRVRQQPAVRVREHATAANCDRTPSFCSTARICERTVVSATKCSRAISSALRPSVSAARTRASRCVNCSKVACARSARARSSRRCSSSSARSVRPMIASPERTRPSVESTSSSGVVTPIHPTAPASRHSARTVRRRSAVSITTRAPVAASGSMSSMPLPTPLRSCVSSSTHCGSNRRA